MDPLALSAEIFAGAIIHVAVFSASASDAVTKPIASSNLWKQIPSVQSWAPKRITTEEMRDKPDPDLGWITEPVEYLHALYGEVITAETSALYHQLQFGLAGPITQGTAQTPGVRSNCSVDAWVKVQMRQHLGTDRYIYDSWSRIHILGDPPAATKATQMPSLRIWSLKSTLNAFNMPAVA